MTTEQSSESRAPAGEHEAPPSRTRIGVLLSFLAATGAAVYFIPFKVPSGLAARPVVILAIMLVAAILNTGTALWVRRERVRFDGVALRSALVLGCLTVAGNYCVSEALVRVDAGVTSVVQQTQIVIIAFGGWLALGERISIRFLAGIAIVLAGIVVMQRPGAGGVSVIESAGVFWSLGGALAFALMHLWTRAVIQRIQPVPVNALRLWFAVLVLLSVPGNAGALVSLEGELWALCVVGAVAGPFLSRLAIMYAVRHITASYSALITLSTPVMAFVFDYAATGAAPSIPQIIGALVILVGVALPVLELVTGERTRRRAG
jgi:drug/metabolite transporter (DMT)-like permease